MASIVTRICIAFSIAASVSTAANAQSRPVIVIPGVMGSKLCDVNGKTVWGDRLSYSRTRIKQLALPRTFDPEQLPHKKCGLIDEVSIIPLFWETDVYNSLHDTLRG